MNLILLGAPGAGKGTQASLLAQKLDLPHVASGDLFRDNIQKGTSLGRMAKSYIERGVLVPDEVTNAMIREQLKEPDCAKGAVLDGYPRNVEQAQALEEIMAQRGEKVDAVLLIRVSKEALVRRLSTRRTCRRCQANYNLLFNSPLQEGVCDRCGGELYQRPDDEEETIARRCQVYLEETTPLIEYYRRQGLLGEVDGEKDIEEVQAELLSALSLVS